jgi:hypothetical protein
MAEIIQLPPKEPKEIPPPSRLLLTTWELSVVDVTMDTIREKTEAYLKEIIELHELIKHHLARARKAGAPMENWRYEQPDNPA